MLTVAQALAAVLDHARALPSAASPLVEALDGVLQDVGHQGEDRPPVTGGATTGAGPGPTSRMHRPLPTSWVTEHRP